MSRVTQRPLSKLTAFARLIIFDKGGTLIEFHGMWSAWAVELARRLETAAGLALADRLFETLGFDSGTRWIDPQGPLALDTMASLRTLAVDLLSESGLTRQAAEEVVAAAWYAPDAVAGVRPLADIPALFTVLRERGLKIAIATMDDRAPTEAILAALGVMPLVDVLVCADDGLPPKPAPDMVWAVCRATGVEPAQAVVVGDAVTDIQMARAAGAGLVVGVLSGVTPEEMLAPQTDVLLPSVADFFKNPPPKGSER
jgi:phosphoglycolate phosphatase